MRLHRVTTLIGAGSIPTFPRSCLSNRAGASDQAASDQTCPARLNTTAPKASLRP